MPATAFRLLPSRVATILTIMALAAVSGFASQRALPAQLRLASLGNVSSFAAALARARVPAGLVLLEGENDKIPVHGPAAAEGKVSLEAVLAAFKESHSDYDAMVAGPIVNVRPVGASACDAILRARVPAVNIADGLGNGLELLAYLAKPSLPKPQPRTGQIGSVISKPEDPVAIPSTPILTLRFPGGTFEEALNGVAMAVPGTAWLLEEHRLGSGHLSCRLRVLREDGSGIGVAYDLAR